MESKLTIKRGDVHVVELRITTPPTNLANGFVKVMVTPSIGGPVTQFDATIDADNVVFWHLDGSLAVGRYRLEVQVTVGTEIVTAPSDGWMELIVLQDLA